MNKQPHCKSGRSILTHLAEKRSPTADSWSRLHQIDDLSSQQIDQMAREVGIESEEFLALMKRKGGPIDRLNRRLAALQLNSDNLRASNTRVFAEMQKRCMLCAEQERCIGDMEEDPASREWENYCPNAGNLATLR